MNTNLLSAAYQKGLNASAFRVFIWLPFALVLSACVAAQQEGASGSGDLVTALAVDAGSSDKETENSEQESDPKKESKTSKSSDAEKSGPETAKKANAGAANAQPKTLFSALARNNDAARSAEKTSKVIKKTGGRTSRTVAVRRKGAPSGLPGVRKRTSIFGIISESKRDEELDEPYEVATIPSNTRRGNFGLILQTKNVQVNCFPRELVRILKRVERKFGRTPIVTSGYRSRAKNRRVRGARNSVHITCKAADIQVPGVSKWKLARYLRSVPGRGGVGTYCHTNSVHIDVAKKRDWNWRCRRKKRRS